MCWETDTKLGNQIGPKFDLSGYKGTKWADLDLDALRDVHQIANSEVATTTAPAEVKMTKAEKIASTELEARVVGIESDMKDIQSALAILLKRSE